MRYSKEKGNWIASKTLFNDLLADRNVSIWQPREDKYDVCVCHEFGNVNEEIWNEHIAKKKEAREEKERDKKSEQFVYCMDVEAMLLCLRTKASTMYYKRKLALHNFTVYDLKTKHVLCYLWDATKADLSANVFASMLYNFVTNKIPFEKGDTITFFLDGCTYQNHSAIVANTFLLLSKTFEIMIIQKILEKEHTELECDSCHATIEARCRHNEVYLPSGYVWLVRTARPDNQYKVEYLDHTFFRLQPLTRVLKRQTKKHLVWSISDGHKAKLVTPNLAVFAEGKHRKTFVNRLDT